MFKTLHNSSLPEELKSIGSLMANALIVLIVLLMKTDP